MLQSVIGGPANGGIEVRLLAPDGVHATSFSLGSAAGRPMMRPQMGMLDLRPAVSLVFSMILSRPGDALSTR
jgi:hypothetical protein